MPIACSEAPFSAAGAAVRFDMRAIQCPLLGRLRGISCRLIYSLPNSSCAPSVESIVDRLVRAVFRWAVNPPTSALEHMHDPAQNAPIILALRAALIGWQMWLNLRPLLIIEPKQVRSHWLAPDSLDQPVESQ